MSRMDRWWWVMGLSALLCLGLAVAFVPWYIAFVLPPDLGGGFPGQLDIVDAGLIVLFLLGVSAMLWFHMGAARERESARQQGAGNASVGWRIADSPLGGEVVGPPLAEITIDWPDSAAARVVDAVRIFIGATVLVGGFLAIGAMLLDYILVLSDVNVPLLRHFIAVTLTQYRNQTNIHTTLLAPVVVIAAVFAGLAFTVPHEVATRAPRLARLAANHMGLIALTRWGRRIQMPWHTVRLIEVHLKPAFPPRSSKLVAAVTVEVSAGPELTTWTAFSSESPERLEQYARLMESIEHLSGRKAVTLGDNDNVSAPGARLDRTAEWLQLGLIEALVVSQGLIWALLSSSAFALFITALVAIIIWFNLPTARSQARRQVAARRETAVGHPWNYDQEAQYETPVGSSVVFDMMRTLFIVLGALFTGIAVLATWTFLVRHQPAFWLSILAIPLGVLLTVAAHRARAIVIIARQDGLLRRNPYGETLIPWNDVGGIVQVQYHFDVSDRAGRRHIVWPSFAFGAPEHGQIPGAMVIPPRQMATIVERRTGLTLRDARPL